MQHHEIKQLQSIALTAALEAGTAIMEVADETLDAADKPDGTPITRADRRANAIICERLSRTAWPVVSEENILPAHAQRRSWTYYWLIDPLDGTKEFIKKNGEFTVNIALIHKQQPVMGVVTAPAMHMAWLGIVQHKPQKINDTRELGQNPGLQPESPGNGERFMSTIQPASNAKPITVAVSRSHPDAKTRALVEKLSARHSGITTYSKGSSLKFCDLAEGQSTIYPRFTPTFEWDTAAGHAILRASGGDIFDLHTGEPLKYTKEDLHNPPFVAFANKNDSKRFFAEFSF